MSQDFVRIKRPDQSTYYYKLKVRCANGHVWFAPCVTLAAHVNAKGNGSWCRECFIDGLRTEIGVAVQIAQQKGGNCLTTTYRNQTQKLSLTCAEGHAFNRTMSELKQGNWCPYCRESQGERVCRYVLEQLLGLTLPRCRPDFLRYRKSQLEFDGYNADRKIAFEYQGQQHYKYFSNVHGTHAAYRAQKRRDARKRAIAAKQGILFIEVPYFPTAGGDPVEHVKQYVEQAFTTAGKRLPTGFRRFTANVSEAYLKGPLWRIQQLVEEKGGQLLSKTWPGTKVKLELCCALGHLWQATASKLTAKRDATWCRTCRDQERRAAKAQVLYKELQLHAAKLSGQFLEDKYSGWKHPHWWSCSAGHRWQATPECVLRQGTWCRVCRVHEAGIRSRTISIERLSAAAAKHGGKCLSSAYLGPTVKHQWECRFGHQWWALAAPILYRNVFCRECGGRRAASTRWGQAA